MGYETPSIRFLTLRNGARLAYAVHGSGPPLVCPAWWVSHLEEDWKDDGFRDLFGGLARDFTVVRYDRPGSGLSDRRRDSADLGEEVATLGELVDHLGFPRFALFAISCAGPPAIAYAAHHPQRVTGLVLFGSFLRGCDVGPVEVRDAIQGLVRAHWGMGSRAITDLFAPGLPRDDVKRVSRAHRQAASPEMAAQLLALTFDVDVESAARGLGVPALVLHREGDHTIRHEAGRELAASLPNATLETIEGDAHVPWIGDVARVRNAIARFLGGHPSETAAREVPPASANEIHRTGDVWRITYAGRSVHLKDARGLTDLAILLTNPGRDIHVAELWSGAHSAAATGSQADPILDEEALQSYKARLRELEADLADAEERGDVATAERHKEERDLLAHELRAAVGLGGRKRRLGEPSERARKAVSSRIRASIKRIGELHPDLATHLEQAITTGNFCVYAPSDAVDWEFSEAR